MWLSHLGITVQLAAIYHSSSVVQTPCEIAEVIDAVDTFDAPDAAELVEVGRDPLAEPACLCAWEESGILIYDGSLAATDFAALLM